jgi:hypothetical protein
MSGYIIFLTTTLVIETSNIKMVSDFDAEIILWKFPHMIVQITYPSALLAH